jgi:hypothetical protein
VRSSRRRCLSRPPILASPRSSEFIVTAAAVRFRSLTPMSAPFRRLIQPSLPLDVYAQCTCRRASRVARFEQARCFSNSPAVLSGHSYAARPCYLQLTDTGQKMGDHKTRQSQGRRGKEQATSAPRQRYHQRRQEQRRRPDPERTPRPRPHDREEKSSPQGLHRGSDSPWPGPLRVRRRAGVHHA